LQTKFVLLISEFKYELQLDTGVKHFNLSLVSWREFQHDIHESEFKADSKQSSNNEATDLDLHMLLTSSKK
jgi:hypothetical protein